MSFYHLPVVGSNPASVDDTDVVEWRLVYELTGAIAERYWHAGQCIWPRASQTWESGVVPANVTETGFTDVSKTWCGGTDDVSGFSYKNPWGCAISGPATDCFPTAWYLCIDDYNPSSGGPNDATRVIKTPITSWSNGGSLHFATIRDYFVSGQLGTQSGTVVADVSSLIGKAYRIIGYPYAVEWSERVIEFPNDNEWGSGFVATSTHTSLTDTDANWSANTHVGRDLLVAGDDGRLKRVSLGTNTATTLFFANQNFFPATNGAYVIVAAGNRAVPGRGPSYPFAFYRGIREDFYTHGPDDVAGGTVLMPAATVRLPFPDGFGGCGKDVQAWNADVFTDQLACDGDEVALCGVSPDRCYSRELFTTIHGLQNAIEALSTLYVEDKSYDGAQYIPFLNPAEMFLLARAAQTAASATVTIQAFTATTGAVTGLNSNTIAIGGITFPAFIQFPLQVWYSIHVAGYTNSSTGDFVPPTYKWGRGYMPNATMLVDESFDAVFLQAQVGLDYSGDDARPVIISPGWSQFEPLEFARVFDNPGVFIADVHTDPGTGVQTAVDPATVTDFATTGCDPGCGVGTWLPRSKSTHYLSRKGESQSWSPPQGFAWEAGDAFGSTNVINIARFAGTGFFDPATATAVPSSGTGSFIKPADVTAPYYERFYVGELAPAHQLARDGQRAGIATSGSAFWIQDPKQNWFDYQWFGGVMRVETGTATSGGATSLTDSTKATGAANCFWALSRFGGANPFLGFTAEVDFGAGTNAGLFAVDVEKRLITGSSTNGTVSWAEPLVHGSAAGKPYRIKEPYALNRYKDRKITLVPTSPTSGTPLPPFKGTVAGNCDDTVFFAAAASNFGGITNLAGWGYEIDDPDVGGVWKWDTATASWSPPSGSDMARIGVISPADFHPNQFENLPGYKRRFGHTQYGNAICAEVFNEIYFCLKVLTAAKWSIHWVEDAVDGVAENNSESEGATSTLTYADCTSVSPPPCTVIDQDAKQKADALWGSNPVPGGGGSPFACSTAQFSQFTFDCHPCGASPADGCSVYGLSRLYSYGEIDNLCPRQASAVTMYAYALCCNGAQPQSCGGTSSSEVIFNANGDPVLFQAWKSFGGLPTGIRTSGRVRLGSLAHPSGSLPNGTSCQRRSEGYQVVDQCAVVKGSLTFIDPPTLPPSSSWFWWWLQGA